MHYISNTTHRATLLAALFLLANYYSACAQPTIVDAAVNPANGHTYYLLASSDWTNAEMVSVALGGHLATVRSLSENNWIWNRWGTNNLWIGLHDPIYGDGSGAQHAADFLWTSGETNAYRNWDAGEPNNTFGLEYFATIILSGSGGASFWNDTQDGSLGLHGVAEVIPTNPPTILDSAVNPANGHTYYLLTNSDWTDAEAAAVGLGGHLATIRNTNENNWVWNRWGTNRSLWIGLYDPVLGDGTGAQHAADFVWSSGETNTFRNWNPGEPNNGNAGEYYAYIYSELLPFNGTWNDGPNATGNYGESPFYGVVEIIAAPPSITSQPASATNNLGANMVLSVRATGSNPMDFHWYFAGTNIDNGSNSTLNLAGISQPYFGNYQVVVSNAYGTITSSVATLDEPATIISQPANVIVSLQSPARFSVLATGYPAPNFYQWSLNGTNIAGANSNSLTLPSVQLSDTGNYQVLVGNAIGATNSLIASLDISPSITAPFMGATPIWGRNTTLSVGAIGNGTLTYQWYFNGQPISGAVYPQLDFSSIQLTNSGFYSVVISSPYGSATNAPYQVAVDPAVVALGFYPGLTITGTVGNSYLIQRSANLSSATNWQTVSSLTLYQPVELWIDTSVDASSPLNNIYFYQALPQ